MEANLDYDRYFGFSINFFYYIIYFYFDNLLMIYLRFNIFIIFYLFNKDLISYK